MPPGVSALMSGSMNCADPPTPPRIESLWKVVSASSQGCVAVCPVLRLENRSPAEMPPLPVRHVIWPQPVEVNGEADVARSNRRRTDEGLVVWKLRTVSDASIVSSLAPPSAVQDLLSGITRSARQK